MRVQPYVPWDVDFIYQGIEVIYRNLGSALNIALWIILIILAVVVPFSIIRAFNGG